MTTARLSVFGLVKLQSDVCLQERPCGIMPDVPVSPTVEDVLAGVDSVLEAAVGMAAEAVVATVVVDSSSSSSGQ